MTKWRAPIVEQSDGSFTVSGRLSSKKRIECSTRLAESDSYHTVAGFMMARAGRLLRQGESVEYNGLRMTVENISGNRIVEAIVERLKDQSAPLPPPEQLEETLFIINPASAAARRSEIGARRDASFKDWESSSLSK